MKKKQKSPMHCCWTGMKQRCDNPRVRQFHDYGGRGISYCDRWKVFKNFLDDMGPKPEGMTLDRIDNDKGYSPENCKWSTRKEQQRNRRMTIKVVIEGVEYILAELAEISGMKPDSIMHRVSQGLSYEQVMSPIKRVNMDNARKAWSASALARAARTSCAVGHEWTEENTYTTPKGWRNCRACHRLKMARAQEARRLIRKFAAE